MTQLYHDGMAIVRKLGKADLFITFTAVTLHLFSWNFQGKGSNPFVAHEVIHQFCHLDWVGCFITTAIWVQRAAEPTVARSSQRCSRRASSVLSIRYCVTCVPNQACTVAERPARRRFRSSNWLSLYGGMAETGVAQERLNMESSTYQGIQVLVRSCRHHTPTSFCFWIRAAN